MKIRLLLAALSTSLLIPLAPAAATAGPHHPAPPPPAADYGACQPGTPAVAPPTQTYYDPALPQLGPKPLPRRGVVGKLLHSYQRFGPLTQDRFVAQYLDDQQRFIYPPNDGFVTHGDMVDRHPVELKPRARLDRFGFPGGSFLAPAGTAFGQRALPPQSLNTPDGAPLANYHVYCVIKPFTVDGGPTAPWFGQPGMGTQYKLMTQYLPEAGAALSVTWLLANGYLVEEKPVVRK
ncbi:TNT domain-containing protein [Catellatospora sp. NPDC049609]|uniref:TNT domain-containing protein n=1 Tax=Catellatospora sp. NPDC049609 TaxID=3155505 RepID=UPI00341B6D3D